MQVLFDCRQVSSFIENLLLNKCEVILYETILSYLVKNSIQRNMNRRWETRRRPAGEIAFDCQNNKRNESVTLASKYSFYIFGKSMEKVTCVWKIKLPSTMIYTDSVSILTSTNDWIQFEVFIDVSGSTWTNPSVNSL